MSDSYTVFDQDYQERKRGQELHYYQCGRVCKAVTVKSMYSGRYERCRACHSVALYIYTVPVETDEQKAIHAQGVVLNPWKLPPVPWACTRCGKDGTGNTPIYRADGKVCKACYDAEMAPQHAAEREQYAVYLKRKAEADAAKAAERAAFLRRLAEQEQSVNQATD